MDHEAPPYALTDQNIKALASAIEAKGFDIRTDPTGCDIYLERREGAEISCEAIQIREIVERLRHAVSLEKSVAVTTFAYYAPKLLDFGVLIDHLHADRLTLNSIKRAVRAAGHILLIDAFTGEHVMEMDDETKTHFLAMRRALNKAAGAETESEINQALGECKKVAKTGLGTTPDWQDPLAQVRRLYEYAMVEGTGISLARLAEALKGTCFPDPSICPDPDCPCPSCQQRNVDEAGGINYKAGEY